MKTFAPPLAPPPAIAIAPAAFGTSPSGSLTITGPGAEILPTDTFTPDLVQKSDEGWVLSQTLEENALFLVVARFTADPTGAALVSLSDENGNDWLVFGLATPIAGVTIGEDTVTFTSVTLQGSGDVPPADIVLDGSLSGLDVVTADATTFGSLKAAVGDAGRR